MLSSLNFWEQSFIDGRLLLLFPFRSGNFFVSMKRMETFRVERINDIQTKINMQAQPLDDIRDSNIKAHKQLLFFQVRFRCEQTDK